ncbi:MAG: sigma-54 interaction domain-containing protein [Thermodesulfobacteriota bacterium]
MEHPHELWTCKYVNIVIDSMADGVFTITPEGKIASWNKSMELITGYAKEEAKNRQCTFIHFSSCPENSCPTGMHDCGILTSESGFARECVLESKSGDKIPVLKRAKAIHDEKGELTAIVETVTDLRELKKAREKALKAQNQLEMKSGLKNIVGISPIMEDIYSKIKMAAESEANVLISGETGTGKELVASAIHFLSSRKEEPFVSVNCAALPESLLESELFGHVKGSFTGAFKNRKGRFEEADQGSLFLDEIGEIPLSVQVKLLRAVQEREIERIGDSKKRTVNIRIISATNKDLFEQVKTKNFREDLYYRIKVFPINLPPLRQRKEDIPLLLDFFIKKKRKETKKEILKADKDAVAKLENYSWPGNVRELENAVSYAFVVAGGSVLTPDDFPPEIIKNKTSKIALQEQTQKKPKSKQEFLKILENCEWNKAEAARQTGLSRTSIWKYMKKWKIPLNKN